MSYQFTPRDKAAILEFLFYNVRELKTSKEWTELLCGDFTEDQFEILDPDGWRRINDPDFEKDKIDLPDYINRLGRSTINFSYVNLLRNEAVAD